jgi:hypothetical protein
MALLLTGGVATALRRQAGPHQVVATSLARAGSAPTTAPRAAPTTTAVPAVVVAPAAAHHDPNALVTLGAAVTTEQLRAVKALKGVDAVALVDVGKVTLQGGPANTIGVDPSTFRNFTPAVTAASDQLWKYLAQGTVASSFDMSRDRKLALGVNVAVTPAGSAASSQQWLGAFMSIGLPGVDLVVNHRVSGQLGLVPNAGLVVSAPTADPYTLETALKAVLHTASVVLMRPGLALGSGGVAGGGGLTPAQLSTALTAAVSRVGKPYVWGATGPDGFDCSGLVGWSFAAAGIDLPRTAAEQALAGPVVPLSHLQPGDLLFWSYDPSDPGFIDHVAIYLGKGQMIEAPQTGYTVHVIPLQTGHLVGAIRVSPTVAARMGSPWRP